MMLRPADIPRQPPTGDFLKRITAFLRLLLLLLLHPRIVACVEYGSGFLAQLTRIRQRHGRVSAKRQLFLFTAKAVLEVPEFRTVRFNQQVQALRVAEFVRLIERLRVADGGIGERYSGGSIVYRTGRPSIKPPKTTDVNKPGSTSPHYRV